MSHAISVPIATALIAAALFALAATPGSGSMRDRTQLYPRGDRFPLILLSLTEPEDMREVAKYGWNTAHTYSSEGLTPEFLDACVQAGMFAMGTVPGNGRDEGIPEEEGIEAVRQLSTYDTIAWWDLPEELRYWERGEMLMLANYCWQTRAYGIQPWHWWRHG